MRRLLAFAIFLSATVVTAHTGVENPAVLARMEAMKESQDALETIGRMAKGSLTFDAAQAVDAKAALLDAAIRTPALFEAREADPKSEALPLLWDEFARFRDLNAAAVAAIESLDTSSVDGMRTGLAPIGRACSACHERYRVEN